MAHIYTIINLELTCSQYIISKNSKKMWRGLEETYGNTLHCFGRDRTDFVQNLSSQKLHNLFL